MIGKILTAIVAVVVLAVILFILLVGVISLYMEHGKQEEQNINNN